MSDFSCNKKQNDSSRSSETENRRVGGIAAGTSMRLDPKLAEELKHEHGKLIALSHEIVRIASQRDNGSLIRLLGKFGNALRGHMLKENVRFYVYLRSGLQPAQASLGYHAGTAAARTRSHGFLARVHQCFAMGRSSVVSI